MSNNLSAGKTAKFNYFDGVYDRDFRITMVNGEPWFAAKDICVALGYTNSRKAIIDHVDSEDRGVTKCDTLGGAQDMTIVNESGLFALILSSKLPSAKKFKHWVTSTVLPAIRKHGAYMTPATLRDALRNPDSLLEVLEALRDEQQAHAQARKELKETKGKLAIAQRTPEEVALDIMQQFTFDPDEEGMWSTSQIAKIAGRSAVWLNNFLEAKHIQVRVNGDWALTAPFAQTGMRKTRHFFRRGTDIIWSTWTDTGKRFIEALLKNDGNPKALPEPQKK